MYICDVIKSCSFHTHNIESLVNVSLCTKYFSMQVYIKNQNLKFHYKWLKVDFCNSSNNLRPSTLQNKVWLIWVCYWGISCNGPNMEVNYAKTELRSVWSRQSGWNGCFYAGLFTRLHPGCPIENFSDLLKLMKKCHVETLR